VDKPVGISRRLGPRRTIAGTTLVTAERPQDTGVVGIRERAVARLVTSAIVLLVVAACSPAPTSGDTLYVENDSAMSVVVFLDGSSLGTVSPGFRGPLTNVGSTSPQMLTLSEVAGTELGEWSLGGGDAAWSFEPDPRCGRVDLWLDDPVASFDHPASLEPAACPGVSGLSGVAP
jgi:hypothetical protein